MYGKLSAINSGKPIIACGKLAYLFFENERVTFVIQFECFVQISNDRKLLIRYFPSLIFLVGISLKMSEVFM